MGDRRRDGDRPEWEVEADDLEGVLGRLREFMQPFSKAFVRREQVGHAQTYVAGRLRPLARRTIEPIATANGDQRRPLQKFVGAAPWDDEAAMQELRAQVADELGSSDGVLIVDGSGFPEEGLELGGREAAVPRQVGQAGELPGG